MGCEGADAWREILPCIYLRGYPLHSCTAHSSSNIVVEALSVIAIEFFLSLCAPVESPGTAGDYPEQSAAAP